MTAVPSKLVLENSLNHGQRLWDLFINRMVKGMVTSHNQHVHKLMHMLDSDEVSVNLSQSCHSSSINKSSLTSIFSGIGQNRRWWSSGSCFGPRRGCSCWLSFMVVYVRVLVIVFSVFCLVFCFSSCNLLKCCA